jgi:hypothetical protein
MFLAYKSNSWSVLSPVVQATLQVSLLLRFY